MLSLQIGIRNTVLSYWESSLILLESNPNLDLTLKIFLPPKYMLCFFLPKKILTLHAAYILFEHFFEC